VLLPRPTAANWVNAATCNLCHELLRHVRTCQDWLQTHPTQWTTTTVPIRILFEQTSYSAYSTISLILSVRAWLFVWKLKFMYSTYVHNIQRNGQFHLTENRVLPITKSKGSFLFNAWRNALCAQNAAQCIRFLFHERFLTALPETHCYFPSAAVKVVALLPLPAAGTQQFPTAGSGGFVPPRWVTPIVNICPVPTSESIPRCSSGKFLYCHPIQNF